jgi:thiamine biosynthesis protein ThiS
MIVTINGQKKEFGKEITVSRLLAELNIDPRKVAVERNLQLVRRGEHATASLRDGDNIEIINFVGGG